MMQQSKLQRRSNERNFFLMNVPTVDARTTAFRAAIKPQASLVPYEKRKSLLKNYVN